MKTIKTMVRFFDDVYTNLEAINAEALADWSHKETPEEVIVLMDAEFANDAVVSCYDVQIFSSLEEAVEEAEFDGEEFEVVVEAVQAVETVEASEVATEAVEVKEVTDIINGTNINTKDNTTYNTDAVIKNNFKNKF